MPKECARFRDGDVPEGWVENGCRGRVQGYQGCDIRRDVSNHPGLAGDSAKVARNAQV